MINNENIEKYKEYNKIYIPEELNSENFIYTISGDEITIYTNNNCRTQNLTKYCDCYRYNEKYNIKTQAYECRVDNVGNYKLNYDSISSDINNSSRITNDFKNEYIIMYGILIISIILGIFLIKGSRRV